MKANPNHQMPALRNEIRVAKPLSMPQSGPNMIKTKLKMSWMEEPMYPMVNPRALTLSICSGSAISGRNAL